MIIILEPQKDTYVTNLKTQNNDASLANVGHAATLDLFKLYNENKNAHSWAVFDINAAAGGLSDGDVIQLQDVDGNTITFFVDDAQTSNVDGAGGIQFGTSEDTKNITAGSFVEGIQYEITSAGNTIFTSIGSENNNVGTKFTATGTGSGSGTAIIKDAVIVGLNGIAAANHDLVLQQVINRVTSFNNDLTLNVNAYNNSNNQLILKQNKPGEQGDTNIIFNSNNMDLLNKYTDASSSIIRKFARIEYSNILIKFDLENFKKSWNIGDDITTEGAFSNLKAELILKDVTTGTSKPKDYSLELYSLNKDFDEGIGKDTIYFSDSDTGNFKDISSTQNWEVQSIISDGDAEALIQDVDGRPVTSSSGNIVKGDEDIVFNVTDYISDELEKGTVANPALTDMGFLVKFNDSNIYDNKSYFVKRLGSRHLINKQFVPQLRIKIDDSAYNIPTNSFNKVRYLDNAEDFYLFNRANGNLISFNEPDTVRSGWTIKFNIGSLITNKDTIIPTNFSGDPLQGARKASITAQEMSRYNSTISSYLESNKTYKDTIKWCYKNIETAGNFIAGSLYKIVSVDDGTAGAVVTDFTDVGAANNGAGTLFIATGAGAGTGSAIELDLTSVNTGDTSSLVTATDFAAGNLYKIVSVDDGTENADDTVFEDVGAADSNPGTLFIAKDAGAGTGSAYEINILNIKEIEHTILTEAVEFKTAETSNETRYENLITSIRITENDLFANNGTNSIEVYFVDTKKEFNAVKVPYELPSENLGDVHYQLFDIETGNILIEYDNPATKMFYDGEKYKFNLFLPKLFKNTRVNFKFKYKDPITNVDKFIFNDKYSIRIA